MMSTPEARTTSPASRRTTSPVRAEQLALALSLRTPRAPADRTPAPSRKGEQGAPGSRHPLSRGAAPDQVSRRRRAHAPSAPGSRAPADEPGSWRLDAQTRQIGLRGVAAACRALERAAGPDQAA